MPGPANLYGVASTVVVLSIDGPGAQIPCPAGTETNVLTSLAIAAPTSGYFFPVLWANFNFQVGAAAPTSIVTAIKIGSGSDADTVSFGAPTFYLNNWWTVATEFVGPTSNTIWAGSGSTITLTVNPAAQALQTIVSRSIIMLFRAPDQ